MVGLGDVGGIGPAVGGAAPGIGDLEVTPSEGPPFAFPGIGVDQAGLAVGHEARLVALDRVHAPFPDVSVHIVEPEAIRFLAPHGMSLAGGILGEPAEFSEGPGVGSLVRFELPGRAPGIGPRGACPAGIFPFRLGGQSMFDPRLFG